MELRYFAGEYTAGSAWAELVIEDDVHRAFKSITVANDDSSNYVLLKINDLSNDELKLPAGEAVSLETPVIRLYYQAPTGTPTFRVICD
jgi:hypothetical protein